MKIVTTKHAFEAVRLVLLNYIDDYINSQLLNVGVNYPPQSKQVLGAVMVANIYDELQMYMAKRSMQTMTANTKLKLGENIAIAMYLLLPKIPLLSTDFFTIACVNNWIEQLDRQIHEIKFINQKFITNANS